MDIRIPEAAMALKHVASESNLSDTTEATQILSGDESSVTSSSQTTRVNFGYVQIREYERIVGDHPDTKVGVPLSIGWAYNELDKQPLDQYEENRTSKGILRMSSITRKNILREVFGIPDKELRSAEKEVQRIRQKRDFSIKQSKVSAKTESAVRGFGRKMRKALSSENFLKGISVASSGMMMPMSSS